MDELTLTHLESLDSDMITIGNVDIDAALKSTIARGQTKIRRRRLLTITSVASSVVVVVLVGAFAFAIARDDSHSVRTANKKAKAISRVEQSTTLAPTTTITSSSVPHNKLTPPATATTQLSTVVYRNAGDQSLCEAVTNSDIGSASTMSLWNPAVGETQHFEGGTTGSSSFDLVARESSTAPQGKYIDVVQSVSANVYIYVSNFELTYCDGGLTLHVAQNNPGYTVSTERWTTP
jgi:hypothetical protein